jgi:hypothetical protein
MYPSPQQASRPALAAGLIQQAALARIDPEQHTSIIVQVPIFKY